MHRLCPRLEAFCSTYKKYFRGCIPISVSSMVSPREAIGTRRSSDFGTVRSTTSRPNRWKFNGRRESWHQTIKDREHSAQLNFPNISQYFQDFVRSLKVETCWNFIILSFPLWHLCLGWPSSQVRQLFLPNLIASSGWAKAGHGRTKLGQWMASCTSTDMAYMFTTRIDKHPAGSVAGPRKWWKWVFRHSEERFFSLKTCQKKRSICFVINNPSMTSAWKRATATFFSNFLQRVSGGLHQVFICALPPPLERTHAFPYLRIACMALFRG